MAACPEPRDAPFGQIDSNRSRMSEKKLKPAMSENAKITARTYQTSLRSLKCGSRFVF